MPHRSTRWPALVVVVAAALTACSSTPTEVSAVDRSAGTSSTVSAEPEPPVSSGQDEVQTASPPEPKPEGRGRWIDPAAPSPDPGTNVYAATAANQLNDDSRDARPLVYVPHEVSGTTVVIDPDTHEIVDTFTTGTESHHVVPSWDLSKLYVAASRENLLTEIDPTTGEPGRRIEVDDPYNLYFTPDGSEAIVVAEAYERLDFRDPTTFELHESVQTDCPGLNHLDYSADLSYFVASCEFEGSLIKFDLASRSVVGKLAIDMELSGRTPTTGHSMPQDVRLSPDGTVFFVADLQSDGLYVVDGDRFTQVGFIPAGVGTHSLYPSRDGTRMYVINRGTSIIGGPPGGQGSVSVLDPIRREVVDDWPIPGGGSPDMGNITADGTELWLGGRYDREVYIFDLVNGGFEDRIPVGINPHGLIVWPQPGRFSLGHTGNLR